jgi:hypothetical protein
MVEIVKLPSESDGIQMIVYLQGLAGIVETEEQAKTGWKNMLPWEKESTALAFSMLGGILK